MTQVQPHDLDNSPAYYEWWTSLPHPALGWTPQAYGYEAWRERGRRDKAEIEKLRTALDGMIGEAEFRIIGLTEGMSPEKRAEYLNANPLLVAARSALGTDKASTEVRCNRCGRKSIALPAGSLDTMTQPDGRPCGGVFENASAT